MRKWMLAAVAVALPVTALNAMTVAVFLQKAEALERRGALALVSSDFRLLKNEVTSASQALRAERVAAARAGRRAAYCPPERPALNSDEMLAHFRSLPPAQRERLEVRDALRTLLARKYPCPA